MSDQSLVLSERVPAGDGWIVADGVEGLVSVIIPTFNRANLILDLLNSLAAQTYQPIEIIVVDDGSTDNTQTSVADWAQSRGQKVVLLHQVNAGPGAARNHGLRHARGAFIYFVDSDDLVLPTGLDDMVSAIRDSGMGYCLATIKNADETGTVFPLDFEGVPRSCLTGSYSAAG